MKPFDGAHALPRHTPWPRTPPWVMVGTGMISVQLGAVVAKNLFDQMTPGAVVLLRTGFAAIVLLAVWRPPLRGYSRAQVGLLVAFGASIAVMNFSFYEAIARIPLGVAVTIEFVGPLTVAVIGSRRLLDGLWILLAAAGVVLLTKGGGHLDPVGIALVLVAASMWAVYILLNKRVGQAFPRGGGLALALGFSTLVLLVPGVATGGMALLDPRLLLIGFGIAVLSSVVPYSLEFEAMRRMTTGSFGVLMSLEPAVATLMGLIFLHQRLDPIEVLAIVLVIVASAGAMRASRSAPELPA